MEIRTLHYDDAWTTDAIAFAEQYVRHRILAEQIMRHYNAVTSSECGVHTQAVERLLKQCSEFEQIMEDWDPFEFKAGTTIDTAAFTGLKWALWLQLAIFIVGASVYILLS